MASGWPRERLVGTPQIDTLVEVHWPIPLPARSRTTAISVGAWSSFAGTRCRLTGNGGGSMPGSPICKADCHAPWRTAKCRSLPEECRSRLSSSTLVDHPNGISTVPPRSLIFRTFFSIFCQNSRSASVITATQSSIGLPEHTSRRMRSCRSDSGLSFHGVHPLSTSTISRAPS